MKNLCLVLSITFLMVLMPLSASAYYIVDTGQPFDAGLSVAPGDNAVVFRKNSFASKFSLDELYTITDVDIFLKSKLSVSTRSYYIKIYGDSGLVPDDSSVFYSQLHLSPLLSGDGFQWDGQSYMNTTLEPGSYWAAIESHSFMGLLATNPPFPEAVEGNANKLYGAFQYNPSTEAPALRISGEPGQLGLPGIVNGGLEETFDGWSFRECCYIEWRDVLGNITPTQGQYFGGIGSSYFVTADMVEEFLGMESGLLDTLGDEEVTFGNAFYQDFYALPGDTISFDWDFLLDRQRIWSGNSYAFVFLNGEIYKLADKDFPSFLDAGLNGPDHTGFNPYSITVDSEGSYRIGFGVVETLGEGNGHPYIFIDNIVQTSRGGLGSAVIPEPSTMFLLGFGLIGAAGLKRKKGHITKILCASQTE